MKTPQELAHTTVNLGVRKTNLSTVQVLLLAFMAGMFIAFGALAFITVTATVANPSLARLLGGMVFPLGLTLVLLAGSELLTGNAMTMPFALFAGKVSLVDLLRNWCLVFIGNFIGSLFLVLLISGSKTLALFGGELAVMTIRVAVAKSDLPFLQAFTSGILCNLLVCLAVWISLTGERTLDKIAGLYLPILAFVLCGFEHCVANMFFIPAGMVAARNAAFVELAQAAGLAPESLSMSGFLLGNILPVTLGNLVGGIIIALVYFLVYRPQRS